MLSQYDPQIEYTRKILDTVISKIDNELDKKRIIKITKSDSKKIQEILESNLESGGNGDLMDSDIKYLLNILKKGNPDVTN